MVGVIDAICGASISSVSPVDCVEKLNDTTTLAGSTPTKPPTRRCANVSLQIAFSDALVIGVHVGVLAPAWISLMA